MELLEICSSTISLLPNLEPIHGAGLAFNLAYLNLSMFAYITSIGEQVNKQIENLDANVTAGLGDAVWYKQLSSLVNVKTLEEEEGFFTHGWWISLPGIWGVLYNFMFYWRIGKILSVIATIYVSALLLLGAGHSAGLLLYSETWFSANRIGTDFYWSTAAFLWPIFAVTCGTLVNWQALRFSRYQLGQLPQDKKNAATELLDDAKEKLGQTQIID
jgi:hypothetical protein